MINLAAEFVLLELDAEASGAPARGLWVGRTGTEDEGEDPGPLFGHDAYSRLRALAWKYRNAREDEFSAQLDIVMQVIADRVKARPGVKPEDVDHVIQCLKADRCGCDRCRYGV